MYQRVDALEAAIIELKRVHLHNARASNSDLTHRSIAICEIEERIDGLIKELKKERTATNLLLVVLASKIDKLESRVHGHPGCAGHCAYPGCAGGCAPQNREKETQCQEVDAETEEEECEIDDSLPNGSSNSLMSRIEKETQEAQKKEDEEEEEKVPDPSDPLMEFEIELNDEVEEVTVEVVLKRKRGDEMMSDFARQWVVKRRRIETACVPWH